MSEKSKMGTCIICGQPSMTVVCMHCFFNYDHRTYNRRELEKTRKEPENDPSFYSVQSEPLWPPQSKPGTVNQHTPDPLPNHPRPEIPAARWSEAPFLPEEDDFAESGINSWQELAEMEAAERSPANRFAPTDENPWRSEFEEDDDEMNDDAGLWDEGEEDDPPLLFESQPQAEADLDAEDDPIDTPPARRTGYFMTEPFYPPEPSDRDRRGGDDDRPSYWSSWFSRLPRFH
ncbi:MAG: hypothetical protein RBU29_08975 [bacterium]|nr:hypothetical protein [bacterium]